PNDPYIRMTTPPNFSKELADRYGLFKTIGWVYDTKALQQGDMTEEMFLQDVERTMAWREQLCLDEIDRGNFDLLVSAWTATDRVAHMFWAYRDPKHPLYSEEMARKYGDVVERTYRKMDEIVGKVMGRLQPEDLLMVMSDHGFHSFRKGFSVNTWLVRNGYLAVKGQGDPATAFTDEKYLQGFDWSKSKAYGLGLGMIFLNLQGREGQGTVAPAEAKALAEEIKQKLLQETDPETGDKIFRDVYLFTGAEGAAVEDAPDLQLGYAEGYQTDKSSAAGSAPQELFEANRDKWSGEHASSDVAVTQGILFSNQKLKDGANLTDLGVTALQFLGGKAPADWEGKGLL
ncbi:MAG: alkaline phosphatase family protein, partial [Candidatus Hydrogenedentes bacterium]|nr:alkaline phosphatase family protein [Candidatus Hydrogenedentota bacterium]